MLSHRNFLSPHRAHFLRVSALVAATIIFAAPFLKAQEGEGSSPLELGRRVVPDVIGVVVGPGFNIQGDSMKTGCPCTFSNGIGVGFQGGLMYEKNILSPNAVWRLGTVNIGARLMYESRNLRAAFREYEFLTVRPAGAGSTENPVPNPGNSQSYTVPVLMRHLAEVNYSLLTLNPYISWSPLSIGIFQPYVQLGFQGGLFLQGNSRHTKFILDRTVRLPNDAVSEVTFLQTGTDQIVIQDTAITPPSNIQLAVSATLGVDIPLSTRFRLSPMVNYLMPLTRMSLGVVRPPEPDLSFTVSAWQIMLALKMTLEK